MIGWLENKLFFVRKDAYPDFDRIMSEAQTFAANKHATVIPVVIKPLRRNWADKVVTGDIDT